MASQPLICSSVSSAYHWPSRRGGVHQGRGVLQHFVVAPAQGFDIEHQRLAIERGTWQHRDYQRDQQGNSAAYCRRQ